MEFCWTVDNYCDLVRKRECIRIRSEIASRVRWGQGSLTTFGSEREAIAFMVTRSEGQLAKAKKEVMAIERRLAKLKKKLTSAASQQ